MPISTQTLVSLVLLVGMASGFYLWWKSCPSESRGSKSMRSTYTSKNVRAGDSYHVEENGAIQSFEVLSVHWSGFFLIQVEPTEGHELDRDHKSPSGWTREVPSNRLIEAKQLLELLPPELQHAPSQ